VSQPPDTDPRVVLVETSDALPGLLPFQAWDALGAADEVLLRDRDQHPAARHLYAAGLDLVELEPATLGRDDLDLTRPGSPEDRRYAKALVERVLRGETPVYLLGPDDTGLPPALAGMAANHDLQIELVFFAPMPEGTELLRLVEVMRRLRDPEDGCPWDLQQDHASLLGYLLEEAYELVDAVEGGDDTDIEEELGDVLLQIVFHAQVARDRGAFAVDDVARGIVEKLVRRHPHVFADGAADTAEDVQTNWDTLKAEEKGRTGTFEGVPRTMAGLLLLETLQRKAAKRGVVTEPPSTARMRDEAERLGAEDDPDGVVGAMLEALVSVARELNVDPEVAARSAGRRFRRQAERVAEIAAERGLDLSALDRADQDAIWAETDEA
jgi:XTP/dITP diphosphohydrolase